MRALYLLDCITSDTRMLPKSWSQIEDKHANILAHLIKKQSETEQKTDHGENRERIE